MNFSFLHSPVPRHVRLAWPATELFDSSLNEFPQKSAEEDRVHEGESGGGRVSSNVVLCTMFKNEAAYLEEWLQYHQDVGVTKVTRVSAFMVVARKTCYAGHSRFVVDGISHVHSARLPLHAPPAATGRTLSSESLIS